MRAREILVGFALLTWGARAVAQDSSEIVRGELVAQVQPAVEARDWPRVLDLTARAGAVRWTPSLRMWSAVAHDALGHTLEALDQSTRCATEALANERLNNRREILERCNGLVDRLRPRVGRLVVRPPDPSPRGLVVTVQGTALPAALWGAEYPVLPGAVRVEARSEDGATYAGRVEARAGEVRLVRVVLRRPRDSRVTQAPVVTTGPGVGPWVTVGVGGALLAGAGMFYGLRSLALQDVTDAGCSYGRDGWSCSGDETNPRASYGRAQTYEWVSGAMLGVGAAAVVGGLVWYFVARPGGAERRRAFHLGVTPTGEGAWMTVGSVL